MTAMPRPSKPRRSGISFRILALEPRMMFDGAAAGDVADKTAAASKSADTASATAAAATTTTDTSAKSAAAAEADKSAATATVVRWNGQVSTDTTGTRHEVVVVDTTVADWQTLVAGINPNTPIILLKPDANGGGELEVLAKIMSQYHDLDAIHLVAEGRTGAILLGREVIYSGDMTAASPYLATIGGALKGGGDFMLYSCSVAGSDSGKAFIDSFARALGKVDVAASTDRTGPTRLGGDWDLEYTTGAIETVLPFTLQGMQDISHCLGCSVTGTNGSEVRRDSDNTLLAHYDSSVQDWRFDFAVHLVDTPTYLVAVGDLLSGNWFIGPNISSDGPFVLSNIVECQTPANTAPTVTAGSSSASYTENGSAVTVDNTITVSDAEQANITGATAVISSNFVTGDVLNFTAQNGITGSWNASTHTLTLSGTATKAQYQAALRSITFSSSSDAPTNATRTITWKVDDGQSSNNLSTAVTSTVHVTAVNDTPTGTPSVSGTTQVGQTLTGSAASVADLDGLGTFSYQWQSSTDGSTWSNISGATSSTYSLQQAENGKYVRLKVSYTDGGGTAETVYSTATAAITAPPTTTVSTSTLSADTGSSNTDWITKTAAQTVSGSLSAALVAGETVQVSFDNGSTWQTTSATVGDTTFSIATTLSGANTFRARVTNSTGSSTAFSHAYTLDTTAPSAPTVSISADTGSNASDGVTKTATQTVTVTAEGGATLDIDYGDGTAHGSASGSHTYADGKYTISVTATDAAGNVSSAGTKVIVVDTAAPTNITPSVSQLAVGDATNGATFCTLTATDATNIPSFTDAWTYTLGGTDAGKFSISGGNLVINNSGGLTAGSYSVDVTATDTAGNTYTKTLTLSVVTGPSTTVSTASLSADTGSSATDWITKTAAQTVSGTLSAALVAGETVQVSFDNGSTWQNTSATVGDTTFSIAATLSGANTFKARVTDSIGSSTAFSHSYALDTTITAPSAPDLSAASDSGRSNTDNVTNVTTPIFTGTAEAGATVTLYDTDGTTVLGTATADATTGAWSITSSALSDGSHTVTAKAVDVAGNVSTVSSGLTVTIDTSAPAAPSAPDLTTASDSGENSTDNITTNTSPTFTGTAQAGATVTLYDTDGTTVLGTTTADATTGAWSITSSTLGLSDHTITAKATDPAGNTSVASSGLTITVVTGPAAPTGLAISSDTGQSNSDKITKTATQTISGSGPAGATILIYKNGEQVGSVSADGTGGWSYNTGVLADGTYAFTAKARVSGQDSSASTALNVTVDTAPPAAPHITGISTDDGSSTSDGVTTDRTLTISGTAEAGSKVEVFRNGVSLGIVDADPTTGGWSFDYTGTVLADGSYVFTATATDLAGNTSATSSGFTAKVTTDATAPGAPTLTATGGGTTTAFTASGTAEAGATIKIYDGTTLLGTSTADGTGAWSFSGTLAVGTHTLTATATDAADNISVASGAATITVTAPPAPQPPAPTTTPTDQATPKETKASDTAPVPSAVPVTAVRDPAVTDKPADLQTVVRTTSITTSTGFGEAGTGAATGTGGLGGGTAGGLGGGTTGGFSGGVPALGDTGRTAGSGNTFQVAVAARAPGGGDALVVNTRVPDAAFDPGSRISVTVPGDAFAHTRADATVTLSATRGDGAALPGWMNFNPRTGTFEGTPPPNFRGEVVVKVTARDNDGRQVVQTFKIVVGKDQGTAAPERGQGQPGGRSGALPDQGGNRPGDAPPTGRASLTEQLRQMSFKGGVARHIAMFETIKRGDKVV